MANKQVDAHINDADRNRLYDIMADEADHVDLELPQIEAEMSQAVGFTEDWMAELVDTLELLSPSPYLRMMLILLRRHFEAKMITPSLLLRYSGLPHATATRRLREMEQAGLIDKRPRTKTGKTFTLHPSRKMLAQWQRLSQRLNRIITANFKLEKSADAGSSAAYFFGGSYLKARAIEPMQALNTLLSLPGGLRVLVHGDPTFMVMDNLKRLFEQILGCTIHQRAFSIDRLRQEILENAHRKRSHYDIVAVNLPWLGEFARNQILMPLNKVMAINYLDPADFHPASWQASHWGGDCYGIPTQTTAELLFYRRDLFAEHGIEPPATTDAVLEAARQLHQPHRHRYGIAWNAARGTALGHTFMMAMADFGQPVVKLPKIAGGFDTRHLDRLDYRVTIDTEGGRLAAEYLRELLRYSPPAILSMSWYERVKCYAEGNAAMAYGFTQVAPYFELERKSPAFGQTGYLPHPAGAGEKPIAPLGGYILGIPANIVPERIPAALQALGLFTSPQAQKMFIQNGSRGTPRYSVSEDPDVRQISPIFEVIETMSRQDQMQSWPRPAVPQIQSIIHICGTEIHDMLRGLCSPKQALAQAQRQAEQVIAESIN